MRSRDNIRKSKIKSVDKQSLISANSDNQMSETSALKLNLSIDFNGKKYTQLATPTGDIECEPLSNY